MSSSASPSHSQVCPACGYDGTEPVDRVRRALFSALGALRRQASVHRRDLASRERYGDREGARRRLAMAEEAERNVDLLKQLLDHDR